MSLNEHGLQLPRDSKKRSQWQIDQGPVLKLADGKTCTSSVESGERGRASSARIVGSRTFQ